MLETRRAPDSEALSVLIGLAQRARQAATRLELGFIIVNETIALARYRQAALWTPEQGVLAVSGVAGAEAGAPFTLWLDRVFRGQAADITAPRKLTHADMTGSAKQQWGEWLPAHLLVLPMRAPDNSLTGLVAFAREEPWSEAETLFLAEVTGTYALSLAWHSRTGLARRARARFSAFRFRWVAVALVLMLIAWLPVRLSVLAPAEIVGRDPAAIRAPVDGVIDKVLVRPNATVAAGTLLFTLDTTVAAGKLEVARKSLATARSEYDQAAQEAFSDSRAKAQLGVLAGHIGERQAEIAYLENILARSQVVAPRAGVAVMTDPTEWTGKPVSIGEKILAIADEHDTELEGWLAPGDLIDLPAGARATVFLNADPLTPLHATLLYIAYESQPRPDQTVAHRLRARLDDGEFPRLGLKGTVRLDGERVPLIFWLLRRPLAVVRQTTGL